MARLVYLPSICAESWQLWTVAGDGSCLRDYRFSPTKEIRQHSTGEIESMLEMPENYWETAPHITYMKSEFWREQISFKNEGLGLDPIEELMEGDGGHRLQSLFASRIKALLTEYQPNELAGFIAEWIKGFSHVVERDQFNHWDNSDASDRRDIEDGSSVSNHLN